MTQLTDRLRTKALELSSRLNATDELNVSDLLDAAADEIESLSHDKIRWINRVYDIRQALGCYEKPMLSELGDEVKRRLSAEYERGKRAATQEQEDES